MMRVLACLICLPAIFLFAGPVAAACVENGTDAPLYFTIESRTDGTPTGATRTGATLAPGAELCLPDTPFAVFTAFASIDSVEGCPRLSGADGWDRLEHFLPTDSCRWASHGK